MIPGKTQSKDVFVILPIVEMAKKFCHEYAEFQKTAKSTQFKREIGLDEAIRLVTVLIDDSLNKRMRWTKYKHLEQFEKYVEELFPEWDHLLNDTECEYVYRSMIDPMEIYLLNVLDNVVGSDTWKIWYLQKLGKDLALIEGPDYRIVDWTNRMESGEWT